MGEPAWLAERFEANRSHLKVVAYRMLGSLSDADDAVQESWLRLSRSDTSGVENLNGWLTAVTARICLDMLRSRRERREEPLEMQTSESVASRGNGSDPEAEAILADSVGLALLVVLETLAPAERVAFVLHDLFDLPFDEIAPIVDRSTSAARQLASRARRRVRGGSSAAATDRSRQRAIVDAFLAAAREGDFEALLALLDPDVVLRADGEAVRIGALAELRGAAAVAGHFSGRAAAARRAVVDGAAGAAWAPGGRPRAVFSFTIADGKIVAIDLLSDPEHLERMEVVLLDR